MKREANMTYISRKDRRWDNISLVHMHNGIKSKSGFDVADGGTGNI